MTDLLCRLFVKNRQDVKNPAVRRAYGTMASLVGIAVNLLLSALKLGAGVLCGSVAILADGLNNLSDAGSQVVSLISFKISAKPADRDHPFGHARIEYVTSMIVSLVILTVGVELLRESFVQILRPTDVTYPTPVLWILGFSVLGKLWLMLFHRRLGRIIDSSVMRASSLDSLSDASATGAVLLCALISRATSWRIDGYMGILVSAVILLAGIRVLIDTNNSILGRAPDSETLRYLTDTALEYPEILGIHDLIVHSYGPGNVVASLHAEVDGAANVFETHDVIDQLEKRLWQERSIRATVHMDPIVTDDERVNALRGQVRSLIQELDPRLDLHDFRFVEGMTHSNLIFDVTAPFELKLSDEELKERISDLLSRLDPNFFAVITVDRL